MTCSSFSSIAAVSSAEVSRAGRCGRDERSANPAGLGAVPADPLVDRLPADAQLLGDLARPVPGQDTIDEQPAAQIVVRA
jgi:hypothetical protein